MINSKIFKLKPNTKPILKQWGIELIGARGQEALESMLILWGLRSEKAYKNALSALQ